VHALGPGAAEVPILAVAPQLRGNGLGRALLAQLESALLGAGVGLLLMPGVPYYGSQLQYAQAPQVRARLLVQQPLSPLDAGSLRRAAC
jgi:predicted N-acetyltransferase YhbS